VPMSSRAAEAVLWQLVVRSFLLGGPGRDPGNIPRRPCSFASSAQFLAV
jgi:hypothetical protein